MKLSNTLSLLAVIGPSMAAPKNILPHTRLPTLFTVTTGAPIPTAKGTVTDNDKNPKIVWLEELGDLKHHPRPTSNPVRRNVIQNKELDGPFDFGHRTYVYDDCTLRCTIPGMEADSMEGPCHMVDESNPDLIREVTLCEVQKDMSDIKADFEEELDGMMDRLGGAGGAEPHP